MRIKRPTPPAPLPADDQVRVLVPVLAAQGGAGRSVTAGLLAQAMAPVAPTVLVDPQPRVVSPWPDSIDAEEGAGLPGLFALGREPESFEVAHAAVLRQLPTSTVEHAPEDVYTYSVLTDHRPWDAQPIPTPSDPGWFAALVERGGWSIGVVDTGFPATADHIRDRHRARVSQLASWCRRTDTVPVLAGSATGAGLSGLLQLLTALEMDAVPAAGAIAVVSGTVDGEVPRRLRSRVSRIRDRVATLIELPHDPVLRSDGVAGLDRVDVATLRAGREAAHAIVERSKAKPNPSQAANEAVDTASPTQPNELATDTATSAPTPPPFPTSAFTGMSANTGWVPVRREQHTDPSTGEDARSDS